MGVDLFPLFNPHWAGGIQSEFTLISAEVLSLIVKRPYQVLACRDNQPILASLYIVLVSGLWGL